MLCVHIFRHVRVCERGREWVNAGTTPMKQDCMEELCNAPNIPPSIKNIRKHQSKCTNRMKWNISLELLQARRNVTGTPCALPVSPSPFGTIKVCAEMARNWVSCFATYSVWTLPPVWTFHLVLSRESFLDWSFWFQPKRWHSLGKCLPFHSSCLMSCTQRSASI
jgi:hypothetical protein